MLTIALAAGDCSMLPVSAAEDGISMEASVSENAAESQQAEEEEEEKGTVSGEIPAGQEMVPGETFAGQEAVPEKEAENTASGEMTAWQESVSGNDAEREKEAELPALQIGQIGKGEELPTLKDSGFEYDLPVSFGLSDATILFVNYNVDPAAGQAKKGTLVWSILRGEKGRAAGSTSLVQEEDDWIGFETVPDSPCFTMTEIEEENGLYPMIELTPEETAEPDAYDYYIRAAYYPAAGESKDDMFYTAATVPFLPLADDTDRVQGDGIDAEADTTEEKTTAVQDPDLAKKEEGLLNETERDAQEAAEDAEAEDSTLSENNLEERLSTLSENDLADSASVLSEENVTQAEDSVRELILDIPDKTAEPDGTFILHSGETVKVTATTIPETIPADITWDSSNETVAAVSEAGEITAGAEGYARITAMCDDQDAVIKVEVAPTDSNDKLVDLSGDIWVAGFQRESEDFVYTGQKITQDIRVYHGDTLLREKTDYTLSYKNNVNAAAYHAAKAPGVTITLKGQYSGSVTLYYTISPLDIKQIDLSNGNPGDPAESGSVGNGSPGYEQTVAYSKNLKIPAPVLTFGKKKLAANKDFVCDYTLLTEQLKEETGLTEVDYKNGDLYQAGTQYQYTVNGTGNFTGSFQMQLVVLKEKGLDFGAASVQLGAKQYEYRGEALSKTDVTIGQVKVNGKALEESLYDYEVCAKTAEGAYVKVFPSAAGRTAGYRGCKKVSLKLTGDRNIKDAIAGDNWVASIPFSQKTVDKNGGIFQAKTGVLRYATEGGSDPLTEGTDYTVKYSNARKAGKVTVTFTGKGRYKGSLKWKYEILPVIQGLRITWGENVTVMDGEPAVRYQKGGAVPDLVIRDQEHNILKNKTDYTVKFKNNNVPGTLMSCAITGKGNYKGYTVVETIRVAPGDIGLASISVSDKPYSTKQNAWKSSVTIKDVNGKKLAAGTDYVKEPTYNYTNMESGALPQKGDTVTVTVQGAGCYKGSELTGSYRIYENNISKLKIVIDPQEYTGEEILLSPGIEIHAYANNTDANKKQNELYGCYEVVEYKNNIKAGTAKVTLRGIGDYGGTKTYSFKIQKKAYRVNRVKGITLDKTSLAMRLAEKETRLTATITPVDTYEELSNPTIIWSSSNSSVATVEADTAGGAAATVTLKKEGTATIKAVTQDGNKTAQCKITIVDVPILKEAGQTIEGEAGETYQLTVMWEESQVQDPAKLKWESNNPDKVSVDQNGLVTMKATGAAVIKMRAGTSTYVQQCYVVVKGEETLPEGRVLTYEQPEGCTDDTPYINKLLREWEGAQKNNQDTYDYLYLPAGVYWIDPVAGGSDGSDYDEFGMYKFGGIILTDNQTLVMSPSALLMTIGNNRNSYHVIYAFGRDNINISGGQIIGDSRIHTGKDGEWGHGIQIDGCTNVTIKDVEISQCWGDGIYLGLYSGWDEEGNPKKTTSRDVTITGCNLHHNRRNNLSITDADYITIDNCKFNNANGTDPQFGIDIEPNEKNNPCEHVTISNSEFKGNAKASMGIMTSANDITLKNCTLDGNFYNWAGKNVVLDGTTIKGEVIDMTGGIIRK